MFTTSIGELIEKKEETTKAYQIIQRSLNACLQYRRYKGSQSFQAVRECISVSGTILYIDILLLGKQFIVCIGGADFILGQPEKIEKHIQQDFISGT